MKTRTYKQSFCGGEITREMAGRMDLDKFQSGLAKCKNMIALPHGPVTKRAGFAYMGRTKAANKKVRLIPFCFSADQTAIVELGEGYARFWVDGKPLLEAAKAATFTAITQASTNVRVSTSPTHGYQQGDTVFIDGLGNKDPRNARLFAAVGVQPSSFFLGDIATLAPIRMPPSPATSGTVSRVYEIQTPYLESELHQITYVQSGDVLTLAHANHPPAELSRLGVANWTHAPISFAPKQAGLTAISGKKITGVYWDGQKYAPNPTTGAGPLYSYKVTAVSPTNRLEESFPSPPLHLVSNQKPLLSIGGGVFTTTVAHGITLSPLLFVTIGGTGDAGLDGLEFTVASIPSTTSLTLLDEYGEPVTGHTMPLARGYIAITAIAVDLTKVGNRIDLTWPRIEGVREYRVYKREGAGAYGYIGTAMRNSFADKNITPDIGVTPPFGDSPFVDENPAAVAYFEQRRCFAGTHLRPAHVSLSRSGAHSNFFSSVPLRDDDSISLAINAQQRNTIRHLVPLADLLALTASGEWRIASMNGDALTPSTISATAQSYNGASYVTPLVTGRSVLYVQAVGGRVREINYANEAQAYLSQDLCVMAPHLFDLHDIVSMAFVRGAAPVLWCVRDDGALLGLTYMPEQKVMAWHRHTTGRNGDDSDRFESVAVVQENGYDVLYASILRKGAGGDFRTIERMAPQPVLLNYGWAFWMGVVHLDCASTYVGEATDCVGGLAHLEGRLASVLADGAVQAPCLVQNGTVTLDVPAAIVVVGLPIVSEIETLPLSVAVDAAGGQGLAKNVNSACFRVSGSSGFKVGFDRDNLIDTSIRTTEKLDETTRLLTGTVDVPLLPDWNSEGGIVITHDLPLPLTILSGAFDVALGS